MKYLVKVKTNRNGAKLILYLKIWFIKIPIEMYGYIDESIWSIIDDDIAKWKKYYGNKLTVIDNRL